MRSLLKGAKTAPEAAARAQVRANETSIQEQEAQCCAKVSKTVAGCHD